MCDTCGCGSDNVKITKPGDENVHKHSHSHNGVEHDHKHDHSSDHEHQHSHDHNHSHDDERRINVETDILQQNNLIAERNRGYFEAKNILELNLMSSPGAGKTTLLEITIEKISATFSVAVIEGDQQTLNDAKRIEATGAPVVQINTGNGCHLDSDMINKAVKTLQLKDNSFTTLNYRQVPD